MKKDSSETPKKSRKTESPRTATIRVPTLTPESYLYLKKKVKELRFIATAIAHIGKGMEALRQSLPPEEFSKLDHQIFPGADEINAELELVHLAGVLDYLTKGKKLPKVVNQLTKEHWTKLLETDEKARNTRLQTILEGTLRHNIDSNRSRLIPVMTSKERTSEDIAKIIMQTPPERNDRLRLLLDSLNNSGRTLKAAANVLEAFKSMPYEVQQQILSADTSSKRRIHFQGKDILHAKYEVSDLQNEGFVHHLDIVKNVAGEITLRLFATRFLSPPER